MIGAGNSAAGRSVRWLRIATVLPLALLAICLTSTSALAKDGQVTVRAAGITNESVTVKLNELGTNDINNREYRLQSGQVTISGHSLRQVMERAGSESEAIDFETIPSITIDRPSGKPITISGDDMRNPDAFPDGPPVFYEDNGATVFVMPGVTEGSSGNRYRFAQAPVGISVGSGVAYEVELSASRTKAKVGQKVTFTASVTGQGAGESLSFDWNFNDGKSRTTTSRKVSHTFTSKGSFAVILDVSGNSGSGQSGILIEVEAVKQRRRRTTLTSSLTAMKEPVARTVAPVEPEPATDSARVRVASAPEPAADSPVFCPGLRCRWLLQLRARFRYRSRSPNPARSSRWTTDWWR